MQFDLYNSRRTMTLSSAEIGKQHQSMNENVPNGVVEENSGHLAHISY